MYHAPNRFYEVAGFYGYQSTQNCFELLNDPERGWLARLNGGQWRACPAEWLPTHYAIARHFQLDLESNDEPEYFALFPPTLPHI